MSNYDHNIKAGNQGDLIKHPALIAALTALAEAHPRPDFCYTDLFAGYGINPIIAGNEWQQGIGLVHSRLNKITDPSLINYRDWYLSRPSLEGGIYPGSALIASDTLTAGDADPEMTLFDISESALASLRQCFDNGTHTIIPCPALPEDQAIADSDFLFIDPPGLYSEQSPTFPSLRYLLEFEHRMTSTAVMFWLPITGNGQLNGETNLTQESIRQLSATGYRIEKVRWADHQRTVGCVIASRLPDTAQQRISEVIKAVTELMGWQHQQC